MSGSQMMLVLAGLVLLGLLTININRVISSSQDQTNNSEYLAVATEVGQNLLNKISSKSFDQGTVSNPVFNDSLLTPANALGFETGETPATYNDVDDYNNYTENDTTPRAGVFHLKVFVNYVDSTNANTILTSSVSRTKRILVDVASDFMKDTVKLYYYKSY